MNIGTALILVWFGIMLGNELCKPEKKRTVAATIISIAMWAILIWLSGGFQ